MQAAWLEDELAKRAAKLPATGARLRAEIPAGLEIPEELDSVPIPEIAEQIAANAPLAVQASLASFVDFLRTDRNCRFSTLVDITAVDYPERETRFDVVYHFLSMYRNHRIRLKTAVREEEIVPSIVSVHPSANWFEEMLVVGMPSKSPPEPKAALAAAMASSAAPRPWVMRVAS